MKRYTGTHSYFSVVLVVLLLLLVGPASFAGCGAFAPVPATRLLQRRQCSSSAGRQYMVLEKAKETVASTRQVQKEDEPENPRLSGLAILLDDGTRQSHSVAENTAFVSGFFKGLSTRDSYRDLITSLYFVYKAMETALDETSDPRVRALDGPELRRLSALKRDMDYFYGSEGWSDGEETIRVSPATRAYVARIEEVAASKKNSHLLIGHQYSRYLGDLFGGQMMGGMATRSLDLQDGKGVAFYQFDDIPNTKNYISSWYQRLNQLDLTDEQRNEIVDEANLVFGLNIAIFEELEGSPFKAMWTLALNSLKLKLGL